MKSLKKRARYPKFNMCNRSYKANTVQSAIDEKATRNKISFYAIQRKKFKNTSGVQLVITYQRVLRNLKKSTTTVPSLSSKYLKIPSGTFQTQWLLMGRSDISVVGRYRYQKNMERKIKEKIWMHRLKSIRTDMIKQFDFIKMNVQCHYY